MHMHVYRMHTWFLRPTFRKLLLRILWARCHSEVLPHLQSPFQLLLKGFLLHLQLFCFFLGSKKNNIHSGAFQMYFLWLWHVSSSPIASRMVWTHLTRKLSYAVVDTTWRCIFLLISQMHANLQSVDYNYCSWNISHFLQVWHISMEMFEMWLDQESPVLNYSPGLAEISTSHIQKTYGGYCWELYLKPCVCLLCVTSSSLRTI